MLYIATQWTILDDAIDVQITPSPARHGRPAKSDAKAVRARRNEPTRIPTALRHTGPFKPRLKAVLHDVSITSGLSRCSLKLGFSQNLRFDWIKMPYWPGFAKSCRSHVFQASPATQQTKTLISYIFGTIVYWNVPQYVIFSVDRLF
jgi:hypothetical protein